MKRPLRGAATVQVPDDDDRSAGTLKIQKIIDRLRDRDDTEHEQILIRLGLGFLAFIYIVANSNYASGAGFHAWLGLGIVGGHFLGALALLAHLLGAPAANVGRRCFGMVLDIVALTAILLWGGGDTALFYPLYLWVTLGMGFRYGQRYLLASAVSTVVGFALVILLTPSWQEHLPLTLSLWAALLILPAYALSLLNKLTHALNRAEEANRAKGRFLATISHELRTPLHAIIGMSELLETKRLDTEQRQMVETVHSAGHTLLEMIEDILDVTRIESGHIADDVHEFDLHEVLKAVRFLLHRQARSKGIDLHFEIDSGLPYRLVGVSRWVKQILINLVGNAVKFTGEGRVVMRVGAEPIDEENILLRIDIEDTGIGISANALERIFEQFVQADESTTRHYGGTGLGLAIARQFAERMGGELTVTSVEGQGSCFSFAAPLRLAFIEEPPLLDGCVLVLGDGEGRYRRLLKTWDADPVVAENWPDAAGILGGGTSIRAILLINPVVDEHRQLFDAIIANHSYLEPIDVITIGGSDLPEDWPCLARLSEDHDADALYRCLRAALATPTTIPGRRQPHVAQARFQQRRILVAEDNRINQRVIEKMLRVGGHSVTIASNGEHLLDRLDDEDRAFDLVLVDLNMPVMNGLDALKLHRIASGADHPPFVALTADATAESKRQCLEAGMAGYLTKPLDLHELLRLIDRATAAHAATDDRHSAEDNVVRHPRFTAPRQVLDLAHIERLRDLGQDDDFFPDVISDFIEDANMLIGELERAAMAADSQAFRDRAHALRSSAAHMGATGIRELCLTWRDFGRSELATRGTQEIMLLRSEFDRLRDALTAEEKPADVDRGPV
ncbi:MAG: ATP-binding protein [Alphaproteobacteria bacterium]|nr:ATP-binding protein [Alphaproteobacteria bacterium]